MALLDLKEFLLDICSGVNMKIGKTGFFIFNAYIRPILSCNRMSRRNRNKILIYFDGNINYGCELGAEPEPEPEPEPDPPDPMASSGSGPSIVVNKDSSTSFSSSFTLY